MKIEDINKQAVGWALFETNDGVRIQKDDGAGLYASDDHVLEVLQERASSGSPGAYLAAAALAHHYASVAGVDLVGTALLPAVRDLLEAYERRGYGVGEEIQALEEALDP